MNNKGYRNSDMKKKLIWVFLLTCVVIPVQSQTVIDYDGNVYNTITIGEREWTKENLKVTHYNNGDVIPHITDQTTWNELNTGAMCYFDNDSLLNAATYGALYNFFAVTDERNICPQGWHVPSDNEWHQMVKAIDANAQQQLGVESMTAGGDLKERDTIHWQSPNTGATNSSNFTALPGGRRSGQDYLNKKIQAYFWTSTEAFMGYPWYRKLSFESETIERWGFPYSEGLSVRCIKDTLTIGIQEKDLGSDFYFYPNPAKNEITFESSEQNLLNIRIIDLSGRTIRSEQLEAGARLDVSDLLSGVYFIQLSGRGKTVARKLVKE